MRFWDSSAIVPLLVAESSGERLLEYLEQDPEMFVWWAAPVEVASVIARRQREGSVSAEQAWKAIEECETLRSAWNEVEPAEDLRSTAERLLRVHALRAADALQLAAALAAANGELSALPFVCVDRRLSETARLEGFQVLG